MIIKAKGWEGKALLLKVTQISLSLVCKVSSFVFGLHELKYGKNIPCVIFPILLLVWEVPRSQKEKNTEWKT